MARKPQLAEPLNEQERLSNRARLLEEVSHGITRLMRHYGKNQAWLARRLGVPSSQVSKMLSGDHNFQLDTLADIALAFGVGVHVEFSKDPHEMRFPEVPPRP